MKLLASNEGSWSPVMTEPFKPGEGIELPWTVDDRTVPELPTCSNLLQETGTDGEEEVKVVVALVAYEVKYIPCNCFPIGQVSLLAASAAVVRKDLSERSRGQGRATRDIDQLQLGALPLHGARSIDGKS